MKREELTKTFKTSWNRKNLWSRWVIQNYISALRAEYYGTNSAWCPYVSQMCCSPSPTRQFPCDCSGQPHPGINWPLLPFCPGIIPPPPFLPPAEPFPWDAGGKCPFLKRIICHETGVAESKRDYRLNVGDNTVSLRRGFAWTQSVCHDKGSDNQHSAGCFLTPIQGNQKLHSTTKGHSGRNSKNACSAALLQYIMRRNQVILT